MATHHCSPSRHADPGRPAEPIKPVELNRRGIPVHADDWTDEDWLDLHRSMKRLIRRIAKRHRNP